MLLEFSSFEAVERDGSTALKIMARAIDGTGRHDLGTYATLNLPQSWHQADNVVMYKKGTLPPTPTPTPTGTLTPTPTGVPTPIPAIDVPEAIATAVVAWNNGTTGITFCEQASGVVCIDSNTDSNSVTISHITPRPTPGSIATPVPSSDCGRSAVACVNGWTGYPHIRNQTLRILYPLHFYVWDYTGRVRRLVYKEYIWTNSITLANNDSDHYYLPVYVMHEFGHTAGLGHSSVSNDVMYARIGSRTTLSDNDEDAMEANYEGHSSHE